MTSIPVDILGLIVSCIVLCILAIKNGSREGRRRH